MDILIVIALYILVLFEVWDRTINIRQKIWYLFKRLFRPLIIYIGGLNERERIKRSSRERQFRDSVNNERDRRIERSKEEKRTTENLRGKTDETIRGRARHFEVITTRER